MSEALARESDISATNQWSVETLRDYFLGLMNANDRRYGDQNAALREILDNLNHRLNARADEIDVRFRERLDESRRSIDLAFDSQQRSVDIAHSAQKEAIAAAFLSAEKATLFALNAANQAVLKAEAATERRFESVNEFRNTLSDQQRTFMPRAEVEVMFTAINQKVDALSMSLNQRVDSLSVALNQKIDQLTISVREIKSTDKGLVSGWGAAVGVVGLVSLIISLYIAFRSMGPVVIK